MTSQKKHPKLIHALRLRCLYCGETRLQAKGKWFDFGEGCPTCDYRFEREVGYYAGSTWMINYSVISLVGIVVAAVCAGFLGLSGLGVASVTSAVVILFGLWFFPFGNALWMYADHVVHPLSSENK